MFSDTRNKLPCQTQPRNILPAILPLSSVLEAPPFEVSDFVRRALGLLASRKGRKLAGADFTQTGTLPCKWTCADESLFTIDLVLYACTGRFPFDKGQLGGRFNPGTLGAGFHHGPLHIDLGGAHVGAVEESGGTFRFGHVLRPIAGTTSTDCGWLMQLLAPFKRVYDQACENILITKTLGSLVASIPNEYVHPGWTGDTVKLLVDLEAIGAETSPVSSRARTGFVHPDHREPSRDGRPSSQCPPPSCAGRSTFLLPEGFASRLSRDRRGRLEMGDTVPMGRALRAQDFHLYDAGTVVDEQGLPRDRVLLYVKDILTATGTQYPLGAAVVSSCIEYNILTDSLRHESCRKYGAASFTGVFIDWYSEEAGNYVNLFVPIGFSVKRPGSCQILEFNPEEIRAMLHDCKPIQPLKDLNALLGYDPDRLEIPAFRFLSGGA